MEPRFDIPVAEIVSLLARAFAVGDEEQILALYVFGSAARGALRADSDIDLAFLGPRGLDPVVVHDVGTRIASRLGRDVDLVDLRTASTVLCAEIVGHGQRLHDANANATAEFEMYALSDYARLEEERRPVVEAFLAKYRG